MKYTFANARLTGTITATPDGVLFSGEIDDLNPEPQFVFALPWMPALAPVEPKPESD